MSFRIDLANQYRPQIIVFWVVGGVMALVLLCAGEPLIAGFAILWIGLGPFLAVRLSFPYNHPRTVYEFTPARVTQSLKGKAVKELAFGEGMRIYRRVGMRRAHVVFSRVEIPKGASLDEWRDRPEVIIVPYLKDRALTAKRYLTPCYEGAREI